MTIITEKTDFLLEVKSKYTYRIFTNGNGEISIEVQLTEDFKNASLDNFALVTTSRENFERFFTVDYINKLFLTLRHNIRSCGRYGTIVQNFLPRWDDLN